jgi:hypothetical protein
MTWNKLKLYTGYVSTLFAKPSSDRQKASKYNHYTILIHILDFQDAYFRNMFYMFIPTHATAFLQLRHEIFLGL